jgi:hypothetical protein
VGGSAAQIKARKNKLDIEASCEAPGKSFLLLFFKKEALPFSNLPPYRIARTTPRFSIAMP